MSIQRTILALSISAAIATIAACGGSGGGSGGTTPTPTPVTPSTKAGTLFDGAVAGADVYCDANSNGSKEAGEETVQTDTNGAFTFLADCKGDVVSVPGTGTDTTSLLTPRGSFRAKPGSSYVTPFTTIQSETGQSDADIKAVMAKLGLGEVDPGSFNPGKDGTTLQASMAVAKVLNDIAAVVSANGGDATQTAAAFKSAARALGNAAKSASGANIFADDTLLSSIISSAAADAFKEVPGWDAAKQANAVKIAREAIKAAVKAIKAAADANAAADLFGNERCADLVKEKSDDGTLDDDKLSDDAAGAVKDDDSITKAQFVAFDNVQLYSAPDVKAATITVSELTGEGSTVTGLTLGTIDHLELATTLTTKALPKSGKKVEIAIDITEPGTTRQLQLTVDKILLKPDAQTGKLQLTVLDGAELSYHAVTHTGVHFVPAAPLKKLNSTLLSSGESGPIVKFATIINRVTDDLATNQKSLMDKLLGTTGNFVIRIVVSEIDVRTGGLASPTKLPFGTIEIPLDIDGNQTNKISGAVFSGKLNFN
jgi:hypothetical protein